MGLFQAPAINVTAGGHLNLTGESPGLLGGSWVVISGVISRVTMVITPIMGLLTPFVTTHEPPSRDLRSQPYMLQEARLRSLHKPFAFYCPNLPAPSGPISEY